MKQDIQITQILEMNGMAVEQGAQLPIMNTLMAQRGKSTNILEDYSF